LKLDMIGPQKQALSVVISNEITENCYVVQGTVNPMQLVGAPGSYLRTAITGACRGGHVNVKTGVSYAVFGSTLYRINSDLTSTSLGTIAGANRVSIADNGAQLVIVTGTGSAGYVYTIATATLSQITDPDFPGADTVDYLDGYFLFATADGQWFICVLGDPTDYNALDFVTNEKSPDDTLTIVEDHGEVFCFGTKTIEVWFNSGNADFPFERNGSAQIERGLYARFAVAKDDNTLFFLGDDLIVYRMQGYTPVVMSDDGTNTELSNYLKNGYADDLANAYAFSYTDHGHKFLVLTVPNRGTHVYDMATQLWHKRKHWDYETHHSAAYMNAYGKHLFGGIDGNLYEWSRDTYTDAGTTLKRRRRTKVFSSEDRLLRYKKLKFIVDAGNGLTTGQGSDPVMVLRWSDDNGRSWSNERLLPLGEQGDYRRRAIARGLGSARSRLYEFYLTDPVKFTVVDAIAAVA
jgi:hypothetical protein